MVDLKLLQILKHRDEYRKVIGRVPMESMEKTTVALLKDIGKYFDKFPSHEKVDLQTFAPLFSSWHPKLTVEQKHAYANILKRVAQDVSDDERGVVLQSLLELRLSSDLATLVMKFEEGDVGNIHGELDTILTQFQRDARIKGLDFVRVDVDEMLNQEINDEGMRWRLDCLNESMRGLRPGDFGIVAGRPDKGKCLAPDTPVRMFPYGIKIAKDVMNGDQLMGPDSTPRNVTGVTTGTDEMYRVTYPWGESYTVNSEHVLHLQVRGKYINMPVREYLTKSTSWQAKAKGVKAVVEYPEAELLMDPYLLGVWLGDGTTGKPQITTMDPEIVEAFDARYTRTNEWHGRAGKAGTYDYFGEMNQHLTALGVKGNKHVPETYLRASREQRLELLAGLIDSDGYAGDVYELVTKLDVLKDGYIDLARGLGFHAVAARSFKKATNTDHAGDWYWRIRIGAEAFGEVPVRLTRKRGNAKSRKRSGLHFGFTVEPVGVGEYNGFCLDGDHLFLLGDYTITHNTTFLASEITQLASQTDRPVLWLNNEGPGNRIYTRLWQAALGLPLSSLIDLHRKGRMITEYEAAIKGDQWKIKVFDIHGMDTYAVERIIEQHKPSIVVYDMIDNIRGFGDSARTDLALEKMYQWARELAVKYDFAGIATSQISADGADTQFPSDHMLKDSKCFAPGTPVRMFDGTERRIEDIRVGEQVMGIDGTPRNVIGTGRGQEQMYRVAGGGWSFDCNESHNLVVQNRSARPTAGLATGEMRDMPLREFMARGSSRQRLTAVRCRIPYSTQDLPMDPYLFGLWLGDGAQRECRITTGDAEILAYLEALPTYRSTYKQASNCSDVYFGPREWLDAVGVRNNKHIPHIYKTSSIEQRLQLLAGLMDSDGTVDHGNSVIAMSDKRGQLLRDIREVARSLGYKATARLKPSSGSACVSFSATDALPCLLQRKVSVCRERGDRMTVTPLGFGDYVGITVDGDSRYCHAAYVALRNTGKQGACDFILMIGSVDDPGYANARFIGLPKNKLRREGSPGDPRACVAYKPQIARYEDLPVVGGEDEKDEP
jgi:replicative DNA helicase